VDYGELKKTGPRSLTSMIYGQLRSDIISCAIEPGEKLKTAALQERFGVGLSAVREALSRLATEGLVQAEDQRGFRVAPVSAEDFKDLVKTRIQIEGLALRQAIELGDKVWREGLKMAFDQLSATPLVAPADPKHVTEQWAQAHRIFHRALVSGCNSEWLLHFRDTLYEHAERYRRLTVIFEPNRDVPSEHREIAEATLSRKPNLAVAALERHFSRTAQIIFANLGRQPHNIAAGTK
jgi:DNA-binding GntR family transcriptional regulator